MRDDPGILLACDTLPENPWSRDRLPAIRAALVGLRHEIIDIYDFDTRAEAHHLHRTKARNFFRDDCIAELNRKFRDRVLASDCRIVVLGTVDNYGQFLLPETIRELRAAGRYVVGILGDDEFTFERNWPYVFLFDRVIAYVKPMVDRYNALRPGCCLYLPNSCFFVERNFETLQVPEEGKRHEVALFGSVFPARLRLVEHLVDAGVPLSLFGSRGWLESQRLRPYYRGFVASDDFDRTVRESRLVLALLEDHLTGAAHMNTKIWEAVRNGQLCLTTRYAPLMDDYGLVENEDIVFYDSAEDLAAKILHYLAHPAECRQIAARLFQKIQARFDYVDLFRGLFAGLIQTERLTREVLPPPTPATVTLLGAPMATDEAAGFPVWRFDRSMGWRRRVAAEFHSRVKTSHVILTSGSYRYDPGLHVWLARGPRAFLPSIGRLRTAGVDTLGDDTLLWDAASFESFHLRGSWRKRIRARAVGIVFPATHPAVRCGSENPFARAWTGLGRMLVRSYRALRERRLAKTAPKMVT